ncbi:PaaI family thioesterase [Brevundimonas sp. Root1279]|uniref:PaaI family thioesterase n=1 Tax=Brevundimonas sp. Root1279 TaxID=1736443 RepID=UPI0006F55144|nr:PaaI family thioesterase [Brevundimonas sp. Root1279]KQW79643.1 thioesterase [Brevundimonas sp. Root1279]
MSELLNRLPYARFLGLTSAEDGDALTVTMPFAEKLIGNPVLPALHGGSTAALLELTAVAQVALLYPRLRLPRPINVTVAYLRSGRPVDVQARARISKAGRRVAHVLAEAWQEDEAQPIASLTAHFLLAEHDL